MAENQFTEYDAILAKEIIDNAYDLQADYSERNNINNDLEDMFMLRWKGAKKFEELAHGVKATTSQIPRVKILGAERMIKTTDTIFRMREELQPIKGTPLDVIERMVNVVWRQSSRLRGQPLHYDIIRSALVFDEICIGINCVRDLIAGLEKALENTDDLLLKNQLKRLKEAEKLSPYMIEVYHPNTCYPVNDSFGLKSMLRIYKAKARDLYDQFGKEAVENVTGRKYKESDLIEVADWYGFDFRQFWLWGTDKPLWQVETKLPFIPFVDQTVEGGMLHNNEQDRRQGFLYTVLQSNIWYNDCLAKSILYKNVWEFGATTRLDYVAPELNPDAKPRFNFDAEVPHVERDAGSQLNVLQFQAIPIELREAIANAATEMEAATLYSSVLGQPLSGAPAYSLVALLNMAGRQSLNAVVQKANWSIADAGKIVLRWIKLNKRKAEVFDGEDVLVVKPNMIPDNFELECSLELDLAQDQLTNSQIALNLNQAGLTDRKWIRENILKVEDSDAMEERVVGERMIDMMVQREMQQALDEYNRNQAAMMQPQQAPAMPKESGVLPGTEEGNVPEQLMPEMLQGGQPGVQRVQPMPVAGRTMGGY